MQKWGHPFTWHHKVSSCDHICSGNVKGEFKQCICDEHNNQEVDASDKGKGIHYRENYKKTGYVIYAVSTLYSI